MAGFDNEVLNAINWDFRGVTPVVAQVTAQGQLPIGTGGSPSIEVGTLTSPNGSVTIGYSSPNITLEASGAASSITSLTDADSPYTVLSTDYYMSCDVSGGTLTIELPDAPTTNRVFVIKDATGSAGTNNITITTVGGVVNIDGATSFTMNTNFQATQIIFNTTSSAYEVF